MSVSWWLIWPRAGRIGSESAYETHWRFFIIRFLNEVQQ